MTVPDYSHDQELLAREIREAIGEFDKKNLDRQDVKEVLEWEAVKVYQGQKENLPWIEGLGKKHELQTL